MKLNESFARTKANTFYMIGKKVIEITTGLKCGTIINQRLRSFWPLKVTFIVKNLLEDVDILIPLGFIPCEVLDDGVAKLCKDYDMYFIRKVIPICHDDKTQIRD